MGNEEAAAPPVHCSSPASSPSPLRADGVLSLAACVAFAKSSRAMRRPMMRASVRATASTLRKAFGSGPAVPALSLAACTGHRRSGLSSSGLMACRLSAAAPVVIGGIVRGPPRGGIGDPAVDVGFSPAGSVGADPELSREGAFRDLAVDGGPRQAGAGENRFQADDTVWLAHGRTALCWLFLTIAETSESNELLFRNSYLAGVVLRRRNGGKYWKPTVRSRVLCPFRDRD